MKPAIDSPSLSFIFIIAAGFFSIEVAKYLYMPMLGDLNELSILLISTVTPTILLILLLGWLLKSPTRLEKALKESEEEFRTLFESAPDAIFLADPGTGIIIDANSMASKLTGRPHEEIVGMHQEQLHPPRKEEYSRRTFREHVICAEQKEYVRPIENLLLRPDGTEVYVEVLAQMVIIKGRRILQGVFRDITERKKAEEELLMFKLGIERSDESIFITNIEGSIIYVNPAFEKIYGYRMEEVLGKTPRIIKSGMLPSEAYKPFWDTLLSKNVVVGELVNRTKDGRLLNIAGSANPILNNDGNIIGFLAIQHNITQAKKADELLRKNMSMLEKAQEIGQMGSWEWDMATNELVWSDQVYKLYGLDPAKDRPVYDTVVNTMTPETRNWFLKAIDDTLIHGMPFDGEYSLFRPDGTLRHTHTRGEVIRDEKGKPVRMFGMVQDITENRKAEEEIKRRSRELATMLEVSQSLIATLDMATVLNTITESAVNLMGLKTAAIYLLDGNELYLGAAIPPLPADFPDSFRRASLRDHPHIMKALTAGNPIILPDTARSDLTPAEKTICEARNLRTVLYAPLMVKKQAVGTLILGILDEPGVFAKNDIDLCRALSNLAALAITNVRLHDSILLYASELEERIVERKQAEEDLKRSKEFSETILDSINHEISIINVEDFCIIDANWAVLDRLKMEKEGLIGKKCYEMFHMQDSPCTFPDNICPVIETKMTGRYSMAEHIHFNKDGDGRYIEVSASPIKNKNGDVIQVVHISKDITERKLVEKQILTSLKEKEVLLREIHHRVKNNMQIVSSLLWLQSEYIRDKKNLEIFRDSQNRIMSMSLVHEKLYRSKDLAEIDTNEYITDLTNNLFQSYGVTAGTIALKISIGNVSLGIDSAIPCGLIINELITNSLKYAFPDSRKGEISISIHPLNENMVELTVSDNGVGIPYDVDFRKTESLGLRLVTILTENQLHGDIKLDRNKGTEFKIRFKGVK